MRNIRLITLSNFLTGMVFWYGVTASYYNSVGITPAQAGVALAMISVFTFIFDIPSGMLADKWSRKRLLQLSAFFLGLTSLLLLLFPGNIPIFMFSYGVIYGLYVVCSSGSYQALMYDCLHVIHKSDQYSKYQGRAWGLYVAGAGVANIFSGYLFDSSKSIIFDLSIATAALNIVILGLIAEPTFHKKEQSKNIVTDIKQSLRVINVNKVLRNVIIAFSILWVVQSFVYDFSQYWFLGFYDNNVLLGWFWAAFAFMAAIGGVVAHRLTKYVDYVLSGTLATSFIFGLWRSPLALIVFLIHTFFVGVNNNLIETIIQEHTPSAVRASVMSVISTLGRSVAVPTYILFGYLIKIGRMDLVTYIVAFASVAIAIIYFSTVASHSRKQYLQKEH
jgi:MFS family permease